MSDGILIVCPQAVVPAWEEQIKTWRDKEPWDHQDRASAWARPRRASMLALDMGTGKTLTALMTVCDADRQLHTIAVGRGTTKARAAKIAKSMIAKPAGAEPVVIVNYDAVWRGELAKFVGAHKWRVIILDESHRIKSPSGRASRWLASLAKVNPKARLMCLTGTPMPHSPLDLFGQFRFLDPSVFGTSFTQMRARYADCDPMFPSKVRRWLRQNELAALLDRNSFRVASDDVLELPEVIHERINVVLPPKVRAFYQSLETNMIAEIEAGGTVTAANALTKLLRLQQATSGYSVVQRDGDRSESVAIDGTPAKRMALEDWLEDVHINEPLVVFCRFRSDIENVKAACRATGRTHSELSGDRNELAQWQAGDTTVLVVQIQSGGVGIDCTRAAYCVYYSVGFALGDYLQSMARLHRYGQTRCVRFYHLVAEGTVDEKVYEALSKRQEVIDYVLEKLQCRT